MALAEIIAAFAAFFAAGLVKGTTGLGFTTSCLPLLALALGLKPGLALVLLPSIASNVLLLARAGDLRPALARFWPLFAAALPGIAIGLYALDRTHQDDAAVVLGAVLVVYGLLGLAGLQAQLPARLERLFAAPAGLLTGLVNGFTGSQVLPVLPYLMALNLAPRLFIQTINVSFTLSSLAMLAGLGRIGLLTWPLLGVSVLGIAPTFAGVALGSRLRERLSPDGFRRAVLAVLIAIGLTLVARRIAGA
jgi:hypothetical protein